MILNFPFYTVCVIFLLLFMTTKIQVFGASNCSQLLYKKTELTGVLFTEYITNFTVSNLQECANRCPDYPDCRSFGFDMISSPYVCYLYKNNVHWGQLGLNYSFVYYYWQLERRCPIEHGYIYNKSLGVCFKIVSQAEGGKTWLDAQTECEKENGNLFIPNTRDKILMLQEVLNREFNEVDINQYMVIGGNDFHQESLFYWLNGDNITFWESDQPDNYDGKEDCVGFSYLSSKLYLWDIGCEWPMSYVCEVQILG